MKKAVIKGAVIGVVFFMALVLIGYFVNQGNNDLTVEMAKATYSLVYAESDGMQYNCLHGYAKPVETGFERETITVLDEKRSTGIIIDTFGREIKGISFEVRSIDGARLIENGELTEFERRGEQIVLQVALKDLIEEKTEYCLVLLLDCGDEEPVRYYTRVVWADDYNLKEKLDFIRFFHERTFDKERASEISRYLESNSDGDNSTFHAVNIHSSLSQVTWGELQVRKLTEPVPDVTEITAQTAGIRQSYFVVTGNGKEQKYHRIEEYYRIRYTAERTYLLDFERTMEQIVSEENVPFENNKLNLGVNGSEFQFVESGDGNIFVFENLGRLFSYNVTDNKLTVLFGFYNKDNQDARTLYRKHGIRVLNVDEAGNIQFVVYGYMNRGRHEGDVGIQVYYYNGMLNTVEEAIYIPYNRSADILMCELETLFYMNRDNKIFFMLDGSVYEVNLQNKSYEILVADVNDGAVQVSKSGKMAVWQESADLYNCRELLLMDLSAGKQIRIETSDGDYILPLGFMGEDLIYGLTKSSDITKDNAGRIFFPMYVVYIQNVDGKILKKYQQQNIYITGCTIQGNQITLTRVEREEDGGYRQIGDDQIMNSEGADMGKNTVEVINAGIYEKQVQIVLKETVDTKGLKILTPKEVLFEGGREISLAGQESKKERYYVYGPRGVEGICMNPANAVKIAYERSGVVTDDAGNYIFRRGNRVSRNQIMAITAKEVTEGGSSISVCMDTMLALEGVVRNTELQLSQGESPYEILAGSLVDYRVLDLTGCPLDSVLYYVNQDIPVLALLNDGNAVLITGFNESQIVIMDPVSGNLYKRGMSDSAEWFEENGNYFVTYVRKL